jgi:transmembrane sensor
MTPRLTSPSPPESSLEEEASAIFLQRLYGEWTPEHQAAFEGRLAENQSFAQAYRRVDESWRALDAHAEAPELLTYRAEAIDTMRRANAHRWFRPSGSGLARVWRVAAGVAGLAVLGAAWQISPYGYHPGDYRTGIGEQRIVELEDHSRIVIDAETRLQVRFTGDTRSVRLLHGQAEFSVAKDPSRPFKVSAGDRTVVAVGTVFTVEYLGHRMHVAMVEGRVAVLRGEASRTDLTAGEELQVTDDGRTLVTPKADLEAATAWRDGKVIFRTTPLGEAADRMNRYSHLQLRIEDPGLAAQRISGVFEAGDTSGFVSALERYLPVTADSPDPDTIRLKSSSAAAPP